MRLTFTATPATASNAATLGSTTGTQLEGSIAKVNFGSIFAITTDGKALYVATTHDGINRIAYVNVTQEFTQWYQPSGASFTRVQSFVYSDNELFVAADILSSVYSTAPKTAATISCVSSNSTHIGLKWRSLADAYLTTSHRYV